MEAQEEIKALKAEIYDLQKQLGAAISVLNAINAELGGGCTNELQLLDKIKEIKKPA